MLISRHCDDRRERQLGNVFAVMWQIGEFERNFIIMQTSSGTGENIIGDKCIAEDLGG